MKEAFIEVYEALDPILAGIGFARVPGWAKISILLGIVVTPAILIVGCIFWCESRQMKKIEQEARDEDVNEESSSNDEKLESETNLKINKKKID